MKKRKSKYDNINLFPAVKNTKSNSLYGYINNSGKFVILPTFEYASNFNSDGLAIVVKNNLTGVIDTTGKFIVEPTFSNIEEFSEGRAVCTFTDGSMGIIDKLGNIITKKKYQYISKFNNLRAVVANPKPNGNYLYGYIDIDGNEVIKLQYINANDFIDEVAIVQINNDRFELIDVDGFVISSYKYRFVGLYGEGVMAFGNDPLGPLGYMDENGDILIKPMFYSATPFKDGVAIVSTTENFNGPFGVINKLGEFIYSPIYSDIKSLGENRLALGMPLGNANKIVNSIYALGTTECNVLTEFIYLNIDKFDNNLASAYNYNSTFFINSSGNIIPSLPKVKGSGTLELLNNIISANVDYMKLYISLSGKLIYKPNSLILLSRIYSVNKLKYKPNVNYLVYYPKVNLKSNNLTEMKINNRLKTLSNLKEIDKYDDLSFSYLGDFSISFFHKNLLVLKMTGYNYPFGAAHGLETLITPNINLKTGEFYNISDLFKSSLYWVREIDNIINNEIKTNPNYESVYPDGFKGIKDNQGFYVDKNFLYIYFPPYEIAPHSSGFVTFKIPFSKIENIINKKGSFYKAFN
ncbi:WG repeat-containing protein [Clostridium septicum]|uniref:WG repeat-containing protein n=1 Tax=Clostridium septicum TaxID=1504 RepID=A0A9N7JM61_CLOSE|nr:WG repeat-containing protein [Clostridium septicum]AYE35108.1 hypothetical protein CP523_12160 [Clostridium septicum]MDU1312698.1 WG repeat-containing protein [Clostridium septicum]QAS60499.1 DUF3298 domain-containing protein [Clostridium septicum]UEC20241.1 WG repeat-containing protein [Clostridium septicum]USS01705.1 WG repeat-containing protein [Clostridium septicum]